jgi:CspA family cold shock protein
MARGKVKWFDDGTGYGFIEQENGQDILCHFSDVIEEGLESLQEGDEVEFDVVEGLKGPQAANVEKV